jgi:hypothetical protein
MIMEPKVFSRNFRIGCLILLSAATGSVSRAQLTWNNDGAGTSTQPSLWLEASQVTASGGNVSIWGDARGGGISVGNDGTIGVTQPTVSAGSLNGHDVIQFNGSAALFTDSAPASSLFGDTASTMFIVQNLTGSSAPASFAWVATSVPGPGHQAVAINADSTDIAYNHGALGGDVIDGPPPGSTSGFHVLALQRNGTSGSIAVDGSSVTVSGSFSSGSTVSTATSPRLTIGASANNGGAFSPGNFYTGGIAEIVVFSTALSSTDITTVENYLGNKYGISAVPEPSQYATFFGLACIVGALIVRARRHQQIA